MVTDLFAGVRVRDVAAAREWYERLLGSEPSFLPNDAEAVWGLADNRWLYILEDPAGAGHGLVTIMVEDLDGMVAEIAARGVDPVDHEDYGEARKTVFNDPDGNEIGIGQIPADA